MQMFDVAGMVVFGLLGIVAFIAGVAAITINF